MQIDPRHLVQFAAIIEHQSFSTAAKALGTTQPGLSRMVGEMERRLRVKLLAQRRRPVVPTSIGRELAERGAIVRAAIADASLIAGDARKGTRGLLRIGAPPFICDFALAKIIPSYRQARPNVSFDITASYSDELREMLTHNQLDLALGLTSINQGGPRLRYQPLIDIAHAIVCRQGHAILRSGKTIRADQLATAEWISHAENSKLFEVMRDSLAMIGLQDVANVVKSESAGVITTLVQSSDCLTVLPIFSVLDALEEGALSIVPVALPYPLVPLCAMVPIASSVDRVRDHFTTYLRGRFADFQHRSQTLLLQPRSARGRKAKAVT